MNDQIGKVLISQKKNILTENKYLTTKKIERQFNSFF
jgi:hypothetical protein